MFAKQMIKAACSGAMLLIWIAGSAQAVDSLPEPGVSDLTPIRERIKAKDFRNAVEELHVLARKVQNADVYNLLAFSLRNLGDYVNNRLCTIARRSIMTPITKALWNIRESCLSRWATSSGRNKILPDWNNCARKAAKNWKISNRPSQGRPPDKRAQSGRHQGRCVCMGSKSSNRLRIFSSGMMQLSALPKMR